MPRKGIVSKPKAASIKVQGGILVSVLVFAGIIAMFLSGIATLTVSHFNRAMVEANRASAIHLADAGLNYELRWISENTTDPNRAHQAFPGNGQNAAYTGSIAGVPGSYTVKVMNADGTGPWFAPSEPLIQCTGTVGGISRTAQIIAKKKGLFEEYSLFGLNSISIGGNNGQVIGNVGTNGNLTVGGNNGAGAIIGTLTYNGSTPSLLGGNVNSTGAAIQWPTVDQIANAAFPAGGLAWLRNNNSNGNLREFKHGDSTYSLELATPANVVMTNYEMRNQAMNSLTVDNHPDDVAGGSRYANLYEGLISRKVLIFPPGDYYFSAIKFSNTSNYGWIINNAAGRVRIWVTGGTQDDSMDLPVIFTSTDPSKFRLYYNKCQELSIMGNSTFYGGIYAVVAGCQSTVQIGGNSTLYGGLIASNINISGNSQVIFPNNGGNYDDDFALWFGFQNNWKETNPNGGPVFVDGRTN